MKQKNEDGEAVRRVAKSTWDRLTHDLFQGGLFIDKDRELMQMLCDSFGRWVLACDKLDSEGHTIEGSAGSEVKSPWVGIRNDMWAQVCKAAACFGLSPADLAGVRAVQKPSTDEGKARYFKEA